MRICSEGYEMTIDNPPAPTVYVNEMQSSLFYKSDANEMSIGGQCHRRANVNGIRIRRIPGMDEEAIIIGSDVKHGRMGWDEPRERMKCDLFDI